MLGNVLLLNVDYSPIRTISVERAVGLWCVGDVDLIESVEGEFLHSPSITIPKPQVVRLKQHAKIPRKGRTMFSKKRIAIRDNFRCMYCYKTVRGKEASVDHVIPKSQGGKDTWENVVLACRPCNLKKGTKSLEELGWRLDFIPGPPDIIELAYIGRIPEDVIDRWVRGTHRVQDYV